MPQSPSYDVHLYLENDNYRGIKTLIHRQLLCEMTARISQDVLKSTEGVKSNLNYLITGVRGSGKSTFIEKLVDCLRKKLDPFDRSTNAPPRFTTERYIGDTDISHRNIQTLCSFDPSAPVGGDNYFFLTVSP